MGKEAIALAFVAQDLSSRWLRFHRSNGRRVKEGSLLQVAIALIKEASRAVGAVMTTLVWPLFPFLLQLAVFGFWAVVAVHLASWGKPNCRLFMPSSTAGEAAAGQKTCSYPTRFLLH